MKVEELRILEFGFVTTTAMVIPVVYGLVDPRAPTVIRYIGSTDRPMAVRMYEHLGVGGHIICPSSNRRRAWIQQLVKEKSPPNAVCIEEPRLRYLRTREHYWIRYFQKQGMADLNPTKNPYDYELEGEQVNAKR